MDFTMAEKIRLDLHIMTDVFVIIYVEMHY